MKEIIKLLLEQAEQLSTKDLFDFQVQVGAMLYERKEFKEELLVKLKKQEAKLKKHLNT